MKHVSASALTRFKFDTSVCFVNVILSCCEHYSALVISCTLASFWQLGNQLSDCLFEITKNVTINMYIFFTAGKFCAVWETDLDVLEIIHNISDEVFW